MAPDGEEPAPALDQVVERELQPEVEEEQHQAEGGEQLEIVGMRGPATRPGVWGRRGARPHEERDRRETRPAARAGRGARRRGGPPPRATSASPMAQPNTVAEEAGRSSGRPMTTSWSPAWSTSAGSGAMTATPSTRTMAATVMRGVPADLELGDRAVDTGRVGRGAVTQSMSSPPMSASTRATHRGLEVRAREDRAEPARLVVVEGEAGTRRRTSRA